MIPVPEMTSVPRKVRSLAFGEAMAGKPMTGEPTDMAAAPSSVAAATMATTTSATMCERGGGRQRQHAGQNQTDD
jgi:hypothetical protein